MGTAFERTKVAKDNRKPWSPHTSSPKLKRRNSCDDYARNDYSLIKGKRKRLCPFELLAPDLLLASCVWRHNATLKRAVRVDFSIRDISIAVRYWCQVLRRPRAPMLVHEFASLFFEFTSIWSSIFTRCTCLLALVTVLRVGRCQNEGPTPLHVI